MRLIELTFPQVKNKMDISRTAVENRFEFRTQQYLKEY